MRHPSNMKTSPRQKLRLSSQRSFSHRPDVRDKAQFVVDLGCELGLGAQAVPEGMRSVGIDLFPPYVDRARDLKLYTHGVFEFDVVGYMEAWPGASVEGLVYCCEVLEHLPRERGEKLLGLIEEKATFAFVSVPHGLTHQDELDGNPLQRHLSGWSAGDFESRGWSIRVDSDEHDLICAVWVRSEK